MGDSVFTKGEQGQESRPSVSGLLLETFERLSPVCSEMEECFRLDAALRHQEGLAHMP